VGLDPSPHTVNAPVRSQTDAAADQILPPRRRRDRDRTTSIESDLSGDGEVRVLTNIIGNGVATVFVSWWEGELDRGRLRSSLRHKVFAKGARLAPRRVTIPKVAQLCS
jgi:hypothetical protein